MGNAMPMSEVKTSGRMQYPRTDVDRLYVRLEERLDGGGWSWWVTGATVGAISENMAHSDVEPSAARP